MKIYTKTGDKGQTSLANGNRVSKNDLALEAYGTADELNAYVGLLRAKLTDDYMQTQLEWIQNRLFNVGALLAMAPGEWISQNDVEQLEKWIDEIQDTLEPMKGFILPAGNETIAVAHICRTVTRRLERLIVSLPSTKVVSSPDSQFLLPFVNRMSDFWFQFARKIAKNEKISLFLWKK